MTRRENKHPECPAETRRSAGRHNPASISSRQFLLPANHGSIPHCAYSSGVTMLLRGIDGVALYRFTVLCAFLRLPPGKPHSPPTGKLHHILFFGRRAMERFCTARIALDRRIRRDTVGEDAQGDRGDDCPGDGLHSRQRSRFLKDSEQQHDGSEAPGTEPSQKQDRCGAQAGAPRKSAKIQAMMAIPIRAIHS